MGLSDPEIENLSAMAAGTLDPALRMMLKTQTAFHPDASVPMLEADLIATAFFEQSEDVPLRDDALESVMARVDEIDPLPSGIGLPDYLTGLPYELRFVVAQALEDEGWQPRTPGVRILPLKAPCSTIEENGGSIFLFEAKAGAPVRPHRHLGEEYLLILKGALCDEGEPPMKTGSLVCYKPGTVHAPRGMSGGDCVVLAIMTGGLEFLSEFSGAEGLTV